MLRAYSCEVHAKELWNLFKIVVTLDKCSINMEKRNERHFRHLLMNIRDGIHIPILMVPSKRHLLFP
jgi:hypothetical protein